MAVQALNGRVAANAEARSPGYKAGGRRAGTKATGVCAGMADGPGAPKGRAGARRDRRKGAWSPRGWGECDAMGEPDWWKDGCEAVLATAMDALTYADSASKGRPLFAGLELS